jgi:hypothetical protein
LLDPAFDGIRVHAAVPHPRPGRRVEREQRVAGSARRAVGAELERFLHRRHERLAVVLERVRAADLAPEGRPETHVGRQVDGTSQEPEALVDVVAPDGELRRAAQPVDGLFAQRLELFLRAGPGEIGVLRPRRLGVVVPEERRQVVAAVAEALEPPRELGVQPCALRLEQARIRDLACQRVLEEVFRLTGHRRARAATDEVALLERRPVGLAPSEQFADGPGPEDAPDHGGGL